MTRSRTAPSATRRSANLSPIQIRAAIPQFQARIGELEALPVQQITTAGDPRVQALEHAIEATASRVYGPDTHEYHRLRETWSLDITPVAGFVYVGPRFGGRRPPIGPSVAERQDGIERGRQRTTALLSREVALLQEQLGEDGSGAPADRAIRAYSNLDLHTEIARAASDLYRDSHYAQAIVAAVIALNDLVRLRSGETLDGTSLMQKVFSPNTPILKFNDMQDQSNKDEQQGFMMMFSGAVAGLRNPRAHKLIKDDPERALEFIAFVSLLAKLLDGAKK